MKDGIKTTNYTVLSILLCFQYNGAKLAWPIDVDSNETPDKNLLMEKTMTVLYRLIAGMVFISLSACSSLYYNGLEKIGIPKRDVMVHRVE